MAKKDLIILSFIFFIALSAGAFCLKFIPDFSLAGDAAEYDLIARNLSNGKGYVLVEGEPTAVRPPGYPFFLAIIYRLFGYEHQTIKVVQILLLAGIGILAYLLSRKYLGLSETSSFLASTTTALWPYFLLYANLILTEILFTFFLLLAIFSLFVFLKNFSSKSALISGALLAGAALIRPQTLLLPVWLIFFIFIFFKRTEKKIPFMKLLLIFAAFVLILTPWTLRNYVAFQKFIPISSQLNYSLSRAFVTLDYTQDSKALEPGQASLKTLLLARLKNIYLFWNPGAEGERAKILAEKYPAANNLFLIYKTFFLLIVVLALSSLAFIKKRQIFPLWAVIFYFWLFHIILYPYPRYTLPIIPLAIILAFYSFNYLSSRYIGKYISR